MAQTGFAGGTAGASPLQEVGGRTEGCQGVNHQSIVGVEEEGDALFPTQIGNIHLQVEEKQVLISFLSPPSKSCPSCRAKACARRGVCTVPSHWQVICSSGSPGHTMLLSTE